MTINLLERIIEKNTSYNVKNLPFDYATLVSHEEILKQIDNIKNTNNESEREEEKSNLLKIIYTKIYECNFSTQQVKNYFKEVILTQRYKTYLGLAFKFTVKYNQDEDPFIATFIHLAQFFISDCCYEYLWHLENK